jgi:hypothetical protein
LDKHEVLRYLGWRGQEIDRDLNARIEGIMAECETVSRPKWISRKFAIIGKEAGILLEGCQLALTGEAIANHLSGANCAVLFAATLGREADAAIQRLSFTDMTRSVLMDAAASALIEAVCDQAEAELRREFDEQGLFLGGRFSPGYGDLPITLQKDFLAALDAARGIGLSCTPASILTPSKSVTAVMGLFPRPVTPKGNPCVGCESKGKCKYGRNVILCGKAEYK